MVLLAAAMVVVPVTALAIVGRIPIDRDAFVVLPPRPTVSSGAFASDDTAGHAAAAWNVHEESETWSYHAKVTWPSCSATGASW